MIAVREVTDPNKLAGEIRSLNDSRDVHDIQFNQVIKDDLGRWLIVYTFTMKGNDD